MRTLAAAGCDEENLAAPAGSKIILTPAQQKVADDLLAGMVTADVSLLRAAIGTGKTTILRWLSTRLASTFVTARQFMTLLKARSPMALEEAFMDAVHYALDRSDCVLVDDLQLIVDVVQSFEYPRANLINAALSVAIADAEGRKKKLIFSSTGENYPAPLRHRALLCEMDYFEPEDFACICRQYLPSAAVTMLDFEKIHRFAPALTGYQLKNACLWLGRNEAPATTEAFIDYLKSRNFFSNVDLDEVESVCWNDLKGVDDLIEELEAKIALPFENDALAAELGLNPKRGVLLAGPPGTGKTTIGRALAHRLKGKFFLIDGTVNAAANDFYNRVNRVFEEAKRNAPSVIFIDDADVIFEMGNQGLYRYLLTMMDGLESASTAKVCVMLTAMDAAALPPALLRSGRVELWLQTRLPDETARETILRGKLGVLPPPLGSANVEMLARNSRGLSGADLKSVVDEGKLLYAHAIANCRDMLPVEEYFLRAIENCRSNQRNYGWRRAQPFGAGRFGFPISV